MLNYYGSSSSSMDKMIFNSKRVGFMRISTQKNEEPWKRLDELCGARNTSWRWVRGHNDNLLTFRPPFKKYGEFFNH